MENENNAFQPFIIAKYYVFSLGIAELAYSKIKYVDSEEVLIPDDKAEKIIKQYNMHIVFENEDGEKVWEMDKSPFLEKYKGYFSK